MNYNDFGKVIALCLDGLNKIAWDSGEGSYDFYQFVIDLRLMVDEEE